MSAVSEAIRPIEDYLVLSEEEIAAATFQLCVLRDSASEANLTRKLRHTGIPY